VLVVVVVVVSVAVAAAHPACGTTCPMPRLLLAPLLLLASSASAHADDRPLADLPYTPGLDPEAMDRSADPCADFYAFACGGWQKRNPIPPDQARWDVYGKLAAENQRFLWGILEDAASKPERARSAEERLTGDYFAACMDEKAVERAGAAPMKADLDAIAGLRSKRELGRLLGRLHLDSAILFDLSGEPSFESSDRVVAFASAGGLGLPDRENYLATDARAEALRGQYRAHVVRSLRLSGLSAGEAEAGAADVLRIETALARARLPRADRRDPKKIWNVTTRASLQALTPGFAWAEYLQAAGAPAFAWLNVTEPAFFRELEKLLSDEGLPAWKRYLRWHLVSSRMPYLSRAFQDESFAFYGAALRGVKEQKPRWKRCVGWVDRDLGEALGKVFVARAFPPSAKRDAERMVERIQAAMAERILDLDWMGGDTRKAALAKLTAIRNKIGYPARWRSYAGLRVDRRDFAGDVRRALAFETRRQLARIGKPVDRGEWHMTPPTVNAYYDESLNEMNFPAGVLLPPLWDPRIDLAPGYGNTGGTVGHELIHAFDDQGRKFDAKGNLRDWWTEDDAREFEKRAQCIADQFAGYTVVDDVKVNPKLTLGEDIADLGGILVAHAAWRAATRGEALAPADGLTPEQRFFVGNAQWACSNERPEDLRQRALTDPHSPLRWRVNGLFANVREFARAFECRPGQPMVREKPCRVW